MKAASGDPGPVDSIDQVQSAMRAQGYIADRALATAVFLSIRLGKPLLLEGEAGVGKTEVAKTLTAMLDTDLIRLSCYEGLDINHAVYEWNYARQMLEIRLVEAAGTSKKYSVRDLFGPEFLIRRPLLQAVEYPQNHHGAQPVLLIDEIDRADEEFEAFLLELLSEFQITVPEIGTIRATRPPLVILTSNRTRDLHDALKRRCLYHWIEYPPPEKEVQIISARLPNAPATLSGQVSRFMAQLRQADLYKVPGVSETLDWIAALLALDQAALTPEGVDATLGVLLKHQEDIVQIRGVQSSRLVAVATELD
ncbi:MAG: MoxR family ATPase [Chloroflexota bacterium]|nr:MoxR family ATPase [Chloroflexota bacterium]